MKLSDSLAFGLLDTSDELPNEHLREKLRSFTISWARYDYPGPIFEARSIEEILAEALAEGYETCFVQAYGHVIVEPWIPPHQKAKGFYQALSELIATTQEAVVGQWKPGSASATTPQCLLVDLRRWHASGRPSIQSFLANDEQRVATRCFPAEMLKRTYVLGAEHPKQISAFIRFLDGGIADFGPEDAGKCLSDDQRRFLKMVRSHTQGAQRGVFLWNVESYLDVVEPADFGFNGPIGTLFCVAAGFKPNMIVTTHGFDANTRIVYFDYSAQALEFRKLLWAEWDGEDYPHFLEYVFRKLPAPGTFYHLWNDMRPDELNAADFQQAWQAEVDLWGGAQAVKDHWREYRRLPHEFVHCNVLQEPDKLFRRIGNGPNDVIWWSNAFFTVFSNWFYTLSERRRIYDAWVAGLAACNPQLSLYGFDFNNIGVNGIRAKEYADRYFRKGRDYLNPDKPYRIQIRC
jgi:hypothetical protein